MKRFGCEEPGLGVHSARFRSVLRHPQTGFPPRANDTEGEPVLFFAKMVRGGMWQPRARGCSGGVSNRRVTV